MPGFWAFYDFFYYCYFLFLSLSHPILWPFRQWKSQGPILAISQIGNEGKEELTHMSCAPMDEGPRPEAGHSNSMRPKSEAPSYKDSPWPKRVND